MMNYRGGIVRFSVPSNWLEEYEPEGGGTFYEDRPDSGTLRLNVLEFESPTKPAEEMARDAYEKDGPLQNPKGSSIARSFLPSGFGMRRYISPAVEGDEALNIHRWEICVPVPPHTLRVVIFAHTVVAGQEMDPRIATELEFLDGSIRAAEYSQQAGVSGPFHHDRSV
jgi:hypothetical protein